MRVCHILCAIVYLYIVYVLQVTVYVGKRDFVDHVLEVDPIG